MKIKTLFSHPENEETKMKRKRKKFADEKSENEDITDHLVLEMAERYKTMMYINDCFSFLWNT